MSWATRRRFLILLIIGAVVVAFLTILLTATFYKTPSCSDRVQNQGEAGIDCGGACAYLCTNQQLQPTVLFTKTLQSLSGRTDVIAKIENKNANSASKDVQYKIALYDANQTLLKEVSGKIDLPPGATVPLYLSGIISGKIVATRAFLTLDTASIKWFYMNASDRSVPIVSTITQGGTTDSPRIDAVLTNPGLTTLEYVDAIVFVHDENGNVISASQTVIRNIPAQGSAKAVFTWNTAFPRAPSSIEILPIIRLP